MTEYGLFLSFLSRIKTSSTIANIFKSILGCETHKWGNMAELLTAQAQVISSVNVIQGLIPRSWYQVQGAPLCGNVKGGKAWVVNVSRRLLSIVHGLWYRRNPKCGRLESLGRVLTQEGH